MSTSLSLCNWLVVFARQMRKADIRWLFSLCSFAKNNSDHTVQVWWHLWHFILEAFSKNQSEQFAVLLKLNDYKMHFVWRATYFYDYFGYKSHHGFLFKTLTIVCDSVTQFYFWLRPPSITKKNNINPGKRFLSLDTQ